MRRSEVAVVGAGRLGLHLARRLAACGVGPVLLRGHDDAGDDERALLPAGTIRDSWGDPAHEPWPMLVVVAVPDDAIAAVADALARESLTAGTVVLHTSGLLPATALDSCRTAATAVGSWHPLQTFPRPDGGPGVRWEGVACAVEGDPPAEAAAFELARKVGLAPWRIDPADKPVYHAAAAVAGNLTHVVVAAAARMAAAAGLPTSAVDPHPLWPLVASSAAAALADPGLGALTGAIARGDRATVGRHLEVLDPDLADAYRALERLVGRVRATTCLD